MLDFITEKCDVPAAGTSHIPAPGGGYPSQGGG